MNEFWKGFLLMLLIFLILGGYLLSIKDNMPIQISNESGKKTGWVFVRVGDSDELESYLNRLSTKQAMQSKVLYNNTSKMFYIVYLSGVTN